MRVSRAAFTQKVAAGTPPISIGYDPGSPSTLLGTSQRWFMNYGLNVVAASRAGVITSVNWYSPAATTATFCTGSFNGTTFVVTDFEAVSVVSGLNSNLSLTLNVNTGDYLAIYFSTIRNPNRATSVSQVSAFYSTSTTAPSVGASITSWSNLASSAFVLSGTGS